MARTAVCIGGGITGILVARELLLAGWKVTVVEAAHLGSGSSSRSAAGIRQQFSTEGTVRGMRYSVEFYKRFQDEVSDGTSPIVQNGYLFLYNDERAFADAQRRVVMQQAAGLTEVTALNANALQKQFPFVSPDLVGASWCPTDGFLLPHLIYQEGARRVLELGGTIVRNAAVTSAQSQGQRIVSVNTNKGSFSADLFVDCTNAWTHRTAKILGATELPVAPLKRYLWFLQRGGEMSAEQLSSMPLTVSPNGSYCRPENENVLLFGKKSPVEPDWNFSYEDQDRIEPDYDHQGGTDTVPIHLWMELAEALPALESFDGLSSTTSGYYATTPDHNPFLAYDTQQKNLLRMVGFSGHGAMFGPFTALVCRELAEAGHDLEHVVVDSQSIPLAAFAIGRTFNHSERLVL